jgi:ComF family protein
MVAADWNNLLLRQIIYEYKYRFVQELSIPLSYLMTVFLQRIDFVKIFKSSNVDLILIPVPLHGRRLAWRGFNQAELLAQKIATHFNSTLINDILIRSRHALPQMDIKDQNERKENIKTAFAISKKYNFEKNNFLKDKIVILIDDISTTGSTLEECAKTLKPLKPKEIWGLVIARG